jgi:hypothetical protein
MPLRRRLEAVAFGPEVITILQDVYGQVCDELRLHQTPDSLNEIVAETIVALAGQGEQDRDALREAALNAIRG